MRDFAIRKMVSDLERKIIDLERKINTLNVHTYNNLVDIQALLYVFQRYGWVFFFIPLGLGGFFWNKLMDKAVKKVSKALQEEARRVNQEAQRKAQIVNEKAKDAKIEKK